MKSKILMILGSALLLTLFIFPLWKISLSAPQYPTRDLGMLIYIYKFEDDQPHDIKNIDILNHYVGMKEIPEKIPEFKIFPIVILVMSIAGILIGIFKEKNWYLGWFIVMALCAAAGMLDFYLWEQNYGHELNPMAPIKILDDNGNILGFSPPFIGSKRILNIDAHSYPALGGVFLFIGMLLTFVAYLIAPKKK